MLLSEAKSLRHGRIVYVRGQYNADGTATRARVTGAVKTWKTDPSRVQVPIKHGMYDSGYITESNLADFTTTEPASRTPIKKTPRTIRMVSARGVWITQPGTYRTQEGAERAAGREPDKYSAIRVRKFGDGLWRIQWSPK